MTSPPRHPGSDPATGMSGGTGTQRDTQVDPSDTGLARGVEPDHRYRCDACGNVTRFDVVMTATTRRFHHFDLGGTSRVEEEEVLDQQLGSVTCRWCGRADAIRVERAPVSPPQP